MRPSKVKKKKTGKLLLLIIILLIGSISTMNAKEVCFSCHTGETYASIYDSTAHGLKDVSCTDCHIKKTKSAIQAVLEKFTNIFLFSFKNAHPAARPATETCLSCHSAINKLNMIAEDELPDSLKAIGMVMTHDRHFARRDSCRECHRVGEFMKNEKLAIVSFDDPSGCVSCHHKLAHKREEKYDKHIPSEIGCANCHSSKNKCPRMKKISDIKDSERCTECHPNQYIF
jgi:hypothetical protein